MLTYIDDDNDNDSLWEKDSQYETSSYMIHVLERENAN